MEKKTNGTGRRGQSPNHAHAVLVQKNTSAKLEKIRAEHFKRLRETKRQPGFRAPRLFRVPRDPIDPYPNEFAPTISLSFKDYKGVHQPAAITKPKPKLSYFDYIPRSFKEKFEWTKEIFNVEAPIDISFFLIVIILLAFGILMMFSASYNHAFSKYGDGFYFFKRQLAFAGAGLVCLLFFSHLNYRVFQTKLAAGAIAAISFTLMILVKVMGTSQGGAERWLVVAGVTFQPSEIMKFTVIVLMSYWGARQVSARPPSIVAGSSKLHYRLCRLFASVRYGFGFYVMVLMLACGLTIIQPHLSGTIIIGCVGMSVILVSGCRLNNFIKLALVIVVGLVIGVIAMKAMGITYFEKRIQSWRDPASDVMFGTFQTWQSLITIGSGGLFGLGLGNSRQKYDFLPASQNDFIFSILCEELGLVGALFVIVLFIIFIFRGFYIASKSRDKFGMLMATGITVQLGLQAMLNIAVAANAIFNTGVSLPFFSYGGTALMLQLSQIGVMLSISRTAEVD